MKTTKGAHPKIRYLAEGAVARLIIDQPARMNAMTLEMWQNLPRYIEKAETDKAIRLITLEGAGDKAFCAGADISLFQHQRSGEAAVLAYDSAVDNASEALATAKKPTLAVIRGICFGGGFALALCCDLRIARAEARFRIPAARLGLGYGFSSIQHLIHKLGTGPVTDLLLSARILGAEEALQLGVLNATWSAKEFETEAAAYIGRIAVNAPLTLRAIKAALIQLAKPESQRDLGIVEKEVAACFVSADYREGQAAFLEKRDPMFKGE